MIYTGACKTPSARIPKWEEQDFFVDYELTTAEEHLLDKSRALEEKEMK